MRRRICLGFAIWLLINVCAHTDFGDRGSAEDCRLAHMSIPSWCKIFGEKSCDAFKSRLAQKCAGKLRGGLLGDSARGTLQCGGLKNFRKFHAIPENKPGNHLSDLGEEGIFFWKKKSKKSEKSKRSNQKKKKTASFLSRAKETMTSAVTAARAASHRAIQVVSGKPQKGPSQKTSSKVQTSSPEIKLGVPFAVNVFQERGPACKVKFNTCNKTTVGKKDMVPVTYRGYTWYRAPVDAHGCSACPDDFYPDRQFMEYDGAGSTGDRAIMSSSVLDRYEGAVSCVKPKPGPVAMFCDPTNAFNMAHLMGTATCFSLGILPSSVLTLGEASLFVVTFRAICLLNKHVQCRSTAGGKMHCAVWKRATFKAVDTCLRRRPDCRTLNHLGQCDQFDYTKCIDKEYGKGILKKQKNSHCVWTCEGTAQGLTIGIKGYIPLQLFPANSKSFDQSSDLAIPLFVATKREKVKTMLMKLGETRVGDWARHEKVEGAFKELEKGGYCASIALLQ